MMGSYDGECRSGQTWRQDPFSRDVMWNWNTGVAACPTTITVAGVRSRDGKGKREEAGLVAGQGGSVM